MPAMVGFPSLPPYPSSSHQLNVSWAPNVYEAYHQIKEIYSRAANILVQEVESLRLQIHIEAVDEAIKILVALEEIAWEERIPKAWLAIKILVALEEIAWEERIPKAWLVNVAETLADLSKELRKAHSQAKNRDERSIIYVDPVALAPAGRRGRPRKVIERKFLQEITSPKRSLRMNRVCAAINVSRNTLKSRMRDAGVDWKYSKVSNTTLDQITRNYRRSKPGSGARYLMGHIRGVHGLKVQQKRLRDSVKRVDRVGLVLKKRRKLRRRRYGVRRPNALWHIDGHHKLILWGFVIHGIVDGFDRLIVAIWTSTNNRASTVLSNYLQAVENFGEPSRIRGDRGKENKAVALYAIAAKGLNRGSFIWGSQFQTEWNHHPIRGEGHDQSPIDIRMMGMLKEGVYVPDDCDELTVEDIQAGYGVYGPDRNAPAGFTGAGYLEDEALDITQAHTEPDTESDDEWEDLPSVHDNKFTEAVRVPRSVNPYQDNPTLETDFFALREEARAEEIIPSGLGILPEEWADGEYPSYEILHTGKRGTKEIWGGDDDDECQRCAHTPARHPKPSSSKTSSDKDIRQPGKHKTKIRDIIAKRLKLPLNSLDRAEKEANDGLLSTQKKKRRSSHLKAKDEVRIMGIIFNPWGTHVDDSGVVELVSPIAASPAASLPMYESIGLAYMDKNGFAFDLTMDHNELFQFLAKHIPVFAYLLDDTSTDTDDDEVDDSPKWAGCNYTRGTLTFAVESSPDAQTLYVKRSSPSRHWSEHYIHIVSIHPISGWDMFPFSGVDAEETFQKQYNQLMAYEKHKSDFLQPQADADHAETSSDICSDNVDNHRGPKRNHSDQDSGMSTNTSPLYSNEPGNIDNESDLAPPEKISSARESCTSSSTADVDNSNDSISEMEVDQQAERNIDSVGEENGRSKNPWRLSQAFELE
ncbi:hypothetical protein V5O48_016377 [Marasmius crinis-equi]|uniref:Integrase catalytic domain-containing protein n=1 Tax=Marasmius crinis-equi TaxID=585013 RepID=A0ABR3ERW0_9AGAR